jgi:hypothetical protein
VPAGRWACRAAIAATKTDTREENLMAHEIETHGTRAAAVFARTDAWHRLGTTLTDVFTAEQAMTVGSLGWRVRKTPLRTGEISPDGVSVLEVPGYFVKGRVAAARDALGLTFAYVEEFQAHAEAMIHQSMTDPQFARMTAELFPAPDRDAPSRTQNAHHDRPFVLMRLWADADTQAAIRGTSWAGYQTVAVYLDHHSPVRTRPDKATARAARLLTTTEPTRIKTRAWQLATACACVGRGRPKGRPRRAGPAEISARGVAIDQQSERITAMSEPTPIEQRTFDATIVEHATAAAEAIRAINHITRGGPMPAPLVYDVLGT